MIQLIGIDLSRDAVDTCWIEVRLEAARLERVRAVQRVGVGTTGRKLFNEKAPTARASVKPGREARLKFVQVVTP